MIEGDSSEAIEEDAKLVYETITQITGGISIIQKNPCLYC